MKLKFTITFFLLLFSFTSVAAQQLFDRRVTTAGNFGLSVTNVGVIGKPDVRNNPAGDPSMEFPRDSGQEHLFEAGLWVGAIYDGQVRVSTAAVTNPTGYSTGRAGYEFTNDGTPLVERSSLPDSEFFSPDATSHQDFVGVFSDRRTTIGGIPISGHEQPIFADVLMENYNWNFGFTENLSYIRYDITNDSDQVWDSVYVGKYADIVVRNVNSATDLGSNFFNRNGIGYIDSLYTTYAFDAGSTDDPSINTYGALTLAGAEYRGNYFHPRNAEFLQEQGITPPQVNAQYWQFSAGAGVYSRPNDDTDRYQRMSSMFPLDGEFNNACGENTHREWLRCAGTLSQGNFISSIHIGPFPEIEPGETITVYFAYSSANKPEQFQGLSGKPVDNSETRVNLYETLDWIFQLVEGEDINDPDDRFNVPEPPPVPRMRAEVGPGSVQLYWDRRSVEATNPLSGEQEFEGFRVYKTEIGDDLRGIITQSSRLIAEYDSLGNDIGFNTGFESIELPEPVTFPGDDVEYHFMYEATGLLSGWQYLFSVTAFDNSFLESSRIANSQRVFPGTPANENFSSGSSEFAVGVYPNPYRVNAAWDGNSPLNRRIMFYNLPHRAEIRVYTLSGDIVARMDHDSANNPGTGRWFSDFGGSERQIAGGEHAWDVLSESNQILRTGLYLYTVKDLDSGEIQRGRLAIIK